MGQAVAGDHSILDIRSHYGITGSGTVRTLGIVAGPVGSAKFSQIESDLNAARSAASLANCTQANGCLQFIDQRGGSSFPADNSAWRKELVADLYLASAFNPAAKYLIVVADTAGTSDGLAAVNRMDAQSVPGAFVAPSWSETAGSDITSMESTLASSSLVWTAQAGQFPGQSPFVVATATTDYSTGADVVSALSAAQCSTVYSRQSYEPNLCSTSGKRSASDLAIVGVSLPITFDGAATSVTSLAAPGAGALARMSLQTTFATRSDVFAGAASKHTDVTSGTDALGQTAVSGTDKATGIGVPSGNLTN